MVIQIYNYAGVLGMQSRMSMPPDSVYGLEIYLVYYFANNHATANKYTANTLEHINGYFTYKKGSL